MHSSGAFWELTDGKRTLSSKRTACGWTTRWRISAAKARRSALLTIARGNDRHYRYLSTPLFGPDWRDGPSASPLSDRSDSSACSAELASTNAPAAVQEWIERSPGW